MATPILDLETITDLPTVAIDGVSYTLLTLAALPVSGMLRLRKVGKRFDALHNLEDRTPEEDRELDALADTICRTILQAPPEVHEKLVGQQRIAVCQAFQQLPSNPRSQTTGSAPRRATTRSTGATNSRGSRGTTQASRRMRG